MKKVLVSQRVDYLADRNETRDALDQQLIRFLLRCELMPIPVPNGFFSVDDNHPQNGIKILDWITEMNASGVVLSGGNDIGSCFERDMTERSLLEYASTKKLPVFGVCRGMQMIGVYAGVELIDVVNHVKVRHQLAGEISHEVNSYHNQALKTCPAGYVVSARSEDGEIEAIRHKDKKWEGWMWHPERELDFNAFEIESIKKLFHE
jgi:N5-(cytidine 5'-diphosphoramidyl)-L-glutamine hydrolase